MKQFAGPARRRRIVVIGNNYYVIPPFAHIGVGFIVNDLIQYNLHLTCIINRQSAYNHIQGPRTIRIEIADFTEIDIAFIRTVRIAVSR